MRVRRVIAGVILVLLASVSYGQEDVAPEFVMRAASEFGAEGEPFVLGGRLADPAAWRATLIFRGRTGGCTSTVVGRRVVLTAAHCVPAGGKASLIVGGTLVKLQCDHHPSYMDGVQDEDPLVYQKTFQDIALCSGNKDIAVEAEWLNTNAADLFIGLPLTLLGYGCTERRGSTSAFGVLYEGETEIESLPNQQSPFIRVTRGATTCHGDSGGGVFRFTNIARTRRDILAVASRSIPRVESLFSPLSDPAARAWLQQWSRDKGVQICGIGSDVVGCRPH